MLVAHRSRTDFGSTNLSSKVHGWHSIYVIVAVLANLGSIKTSLPLRDAMPGSLRTPRRKLSFTNTSLRRDEILWNTWDDGRDVGIAYPRTALEDLRRCRRSLDLLDTDDLQEGLEWTEREMGSIT